jgi:hypothetical protein
VPTYLLPCEECGAYQQIRRTAGVIGGGDGLCASCNTPLASLHQKVMDGGTVLREATKQIGPLIARCCNVEACEQVCVVPGGVNAYWKCPSGCGGLVPDEGVVVTESEDKLTKLRAAFEVGALTQDEYVTAENRILLQKQTAVQNTSAFLSEMTRDRAAAVRFGVPIHGANDDEAARALFAEYDTNGNGLIGPEEVRGLAAALLPDEPWDHSLWPEMCGEYGVDPALGFDFPAFLAFKADAAHLMESVSEAILQLVIEQPSLGLVASVGRCCRNTRRQRRRGPRMRARRRHSRIRRIDLDRQVSVSHETNAHSVATAQRCISMWNISAFAS